MISFRKLKELGKRDVVKKGYELKIPEKLAEADNLKQSLSELKIKVEEKDKEIKELKSKIDLLTSSPIESVNDVDFIGDDEGIGTYLKNVEVYSEIDLYNIGFVYSFSGERKKYHKSGEKGNITISLKTSSGCSSKKEVFNAIKKAYPKLLEYFYK